MKFLHNKLISMKLTPKLVMTFTILFVLILSITTSAIYIGIREIITKNIESELENSSTLINDMIKTAVDVSIKTHLRSISEVTLSNVEYEYKMLQSGDISEAEAKTNALKYLKSLSIGTTGYVYIIDSKGIVLYHPFNELIGTDLSEHEFIQEQMAKHNGYLEYYWANPDDTYPRRKSLNMSYFEPWDWIISVSSYTEEFYELLSVTDFEERVLAIKFGETGYPAIMDDDGTFLVHPVLKGENLIYEDIPQADVVNRVLELKNGIIEYEWQNPEDLTVKKKIMVFSELEEYKWIIAATAYKDEFYKPLRVISYYTIIILIISIIVIVFITVKVSQRIIRPIKQLESSVLKGVNGDLTARLEVAGTDEIGELRNHFNSFMESLELKQKELLSEIGEKNDISEALKVLNNNLENIVEERTIALEVAQKEIIQQEKFLSMNKLIKDIAHNINTPLGTSITSATYIGKTVFNLKDDYWDNKLSKYKLESFFKEFDKSYDLMLMGLTRSTELIQMFSLLTKSNDSLDKSEFNLLEILKHVTNIVVDEKHNLILNCDESLRINSYSEIIELIVLSLIKNAFSHGFKDIANGMVIIDVSVVDNILHLIVSDNGIGINEENISHVFEPFYTGDNQSDQMGLGLSIVYNAVSYILEGKIFIESDESGTKVTIEVPIC